MEVFAYILLCILYYDDRLYNVDGFGDDIAVRFDRNLVILQGNTIDFAVGCTITACSESGLTFELSRPRKPQTGAARTKS